MNTAITTAINTALADYSTTNQMNAAIATALVSYYTKTEVDALIANFITKSVNDLVNYYLKSDTYTKTEVQQLIDAVKQFTYQVVTTLPTATADTMNKIYLVPSTNPETQNVKDEYITIDNGAEAETRYTWEQIGSTTIDLSGYYTALQTDAAISSALSTALADYSTTSAMNTAITTAINTALADYSTTNQMNAAIATAIANYYTKAEVDALIANFITKSVNDLVNYYLKSDTYTKTEVQQLIDAVKQFTYQVVTTLPTATADTMNKIYLVPSTNPETQNVKDEYITIDNGAEAETRYTWEQIGSTTIDLSGYYTALQTDAAISSALSTALADYSTTSAMNTAITTAINTALADYSTTNQMNAAIATAIANYYTKAEVDALIANFITKSVNDLVNYYLKSDTYTKTEVQQLIDAVKQFTYQVVTTLPTATADTMNKIYLVPSTNPETQNVKDEYITIDNGAEAETRYTWEQIGSTTIDLSGYYTALQTDAAISSALSTALADYSTTSAMNTAITTAINTALADYSTTNQMNAAIATALVSYYTKTEVDALIANFITKSVNDLVNYYLKSDTYTKTEVQQLIDAVKQFTYQVVTTLPTATADTMNKIYLVPSTNPETQNVKDEYITIDNGAEAETRYTWEQIGSTTIDLSGYYTALQTDAAISSALSTALADYSTTSAMNTAISTALNNYYTKTETDTELAKKTDKLPMTGAGAATENNFMAIDANGNIKDSGKNASDFQLKVTDCAVIGGGYGLCETASDTVAKTATLDNYLLLKNMPVSIHFQKGINSYASTLNINSQGAKPIFINGVALPPELIKVNTTVTMVYDGTNYNIIAINDKPKPDNPLLVDMGLPSGRLWATRNIDITQPDGFAESPYQYGCSFFSWGNTDGHNPTAQGSFPYTFDSNTYANTPGATITGNLGLSYDAAHANLGGDWRMPTKDEYVELFDSNNTKFIDANGNELTGNNKTTYMYGANGILLESKHNSNRIFFPSSGFADSINWRYRGTEGYYWTTTIINEGNAYGFVFFQIGVYPSHIDGRWPGFVIRPVQ